MLDEGTVDALLLAVFDGSAGCDDELYTIA